MDTFEPPDNVHPLFPGLTAPFGKGADDDPQSEAPEPGQWSGEPVLGPEVAAPDPSEDDRRVADSELDIDEDHELPRDTYDPEPAAQPPSVRRRRTPIRAPKAAAMIVAALAAGAAVNAGRVALTSSTPATKAPSHRGHPLPSPNYQALVRPKAQAHKVSIRHQQPRPHKRTSSTHHHRSTTAKVVEAGYTQAPGPTAAAASTSQSAGSSSGQASNVGAAASTGAAANAATPAATYSAPAAQSSPAASQPAATTTPAASNTTANSASPHTNTSSAFGAAPGSLGPGSSPDG